MFRVTRQQPSDDAISKNRALIKMVFHYFCHTARGEMTGKVKIFCRCGLTIEEFRWAGETYRQAASDPKRTDVHLGVDASISLCKSKTVPSPYSPSSFIRAASRLSAITATRLPTLDGFSQVIALCVCCPGCISRLSEKAIESLLMAR
jgi:hypothetical protein